MRGDVGEGLAVRGTPFTLVKMYTFFLGGGGQPQKGELDAG